MVKIGIVGGRLYEMVKLYPYRKWMDLLDDDDIETYDGYQWSPIEAAYVASINHKYKDAEVVFIDRFDEKLLRAACAPFII